VEFDVPFGINIKDGTYTVSDSNGSVGIVFTRIKKNGNQPGIPSGIEFAEGAVIGGDRWGRLFYTHVKVIFDFVNPISNDITLYFALFDDSIRILRRVLAVCRHVTSDHYVVNITKGDIFSHSITHFDASGNVIPGTLTSMGTDGAGIRFGSAAEVHLDETDRIKGMLKSGDKIPAEEELLLNARDHLYFGNFRIAIIEAETAFEVFVDRFIAERYAKVGKSPSEIEGILDAGLKNLLQVHFQKLTGYDFGSSQE
jgi:hypothetical protein